MRVGVLQYDVLHTKNFNYEYVSLYMKRNSCDLLVLPELAMCGYLFESREELASYAEIIPSGPSTQYMLELSERHSCIIIYGLAERCNGRIFNTAAIVSKGRYIGKYRKVHLSDFEKKFFDSGDKNQVFKVDGVTIGVQICFDLWFPEISREQRRMGADILCVLANFGGETTYHISKIRAIENLCPLVLCNRIGAEQITAMDAQFLGKSTIVDASGYRVYTAPVKEEHFGICNLDAEQRNANIICSDFNSEIAFHYQGQNE